MLEILFITFLISVGFNLLMFLPAFVFKTDKLTDISYALSFIFLTILLFVFSDQSIIKLILVIMILLWALRLGIFLLYRINKTKKDNRFDNMRTNFLKFGRFWLLQGVSVWVILISAILFFQTESLELNVVSIFGVLIWFAGLLIETFADLQKLNFKSNPSNKGKWIDTGLWKYSRHPNYLGEIMIWVGIFIFILPALSVLEIFIAFISPVYISLLLIFISGIPILEKKADKKWGNNTDYLKYKNQTGVLFPKY